MPARKLRSQQFQGGSGGTNEQVHEANAARDVLLAAQLPES